MKYKNMQGAMQTTGVQLKEIREAVGLTPTTLAKKCGKHHNVILSIEKGTTDPSVLLLNELLTALGLELQDFFNERFDELFDQSNEAEHGKMQI
ncbi:helix-turn-helix transcriptional regulator [[Clostridium] innocuum]|nr:helix-turn-helix transcriptional regulator [[Clostridium] innocuum]